VQWHQLGHMQVCTLLQTDNHTSTPPLCFLQAGCPSCRPTNSVKASSYAVYTCLYTVHFSDVPCGQFDIVDACSGSTHLSGLFGTVIFLLLLFPFCTSVSVVPSQNHTFLLCTFQENFLVSCIWQKAGAIVIFLLAQY